MTTASSKRLRRSLFDVSHGQADRSYNDRNSTDYAPQQEENCLLDCKNGGSCRMGMAVHGFAAELLEDESNLHHITTMHCVCPPGWTGLTCEIKLSVCNSKCWNGQPCTTSQDDYGMPFNHCECDALATDFTLPYVTHFCGQLATMSCSGSFCKNGGKCLGKRGCECREGWDGPQCAHVAGRAPPTQPVESSDKIAFSIFACAIAAYILATVWFYNRKRRRRQSLKKNSNNHNKLDYDAFLDEYESSNDFQESFDLKSYKSKSYSDFEASEEEYSYESEEGDEESSSEEESSESEKDDVLDAASPLYEEPKTGASIL